MVTFEAGKSKKKNKIRKATHVPRQQSNIKLAVLLKKSLCNAESSSERIYIHTYVCVRKKATTTNKQLTVAFFWVGMWYFSLVIHCCIA